MESKGQPVHNGQTSAPAPADFAERNRGSVLPIAQLMLRQIPVWQLSLLTSLTPLLRRELSFLPVADAAMSG
jgi:hypothetical protein